MECQRLSTGAYETGCYLIFLPEKSQLYIIDPGFDANLIIPAAQKFPFTSAEILLTHAHIDHISAVGAVARALKIDTIRLGAADHSIYYSTQNCLPPYYPALAEIDKPQVTIYKPNADYQVLPLPGHTPGGVGLLFKQSSPAKLFCGDTIFRESIGRTDLPGGKFSALMNSIKTQILTLDNSVELFPGHGPGSTVGFERRHNPYLDENYYEM